MAVRGSPWHSVAVKRERCKKIPCYIWGVGTFRFPFYPRLWLLKLEVEESRHKISLVGPPPCYSDILSKKIQKGLKIACFCPKNTCLLSKRKVTDFGGTLPPCTDKKYWRKSGYGFGGYPPPLYRQNPQNGI